MFKFLKMQIEMGRIVNQKFIDFQLEKKRITKEEHEILTKVFNEVNKDKKRN